jgi:hypothetical protein
MEAYKTTCPDCGHIRFWTGYKTGIGKTAHQLAEMEKDQTTCVKCGSTRAKTDLDHETDFGQALDQQTHFLADIIKSVLENKDKSNPRGDS